MQKGLCTDKPGVGGPDLFPYKRVLSIPKHQKTVPASLICLFHYYMLQDEEDDLALSEIERVRCTYYGTMCRQRGVGLLKYSFV